METVDLTSNSLAPEMQSNSDRVEKQSPAEKRAACLQQLLEISKTDGVAALSELQAHAAALASELAIPSTRDEDWRFTDLSKIVAAQFVAADGKASISADAIADFVLPEAQSSRIVFVDGVYSAELSDLSAADNVTVGNSDALATVSKHVAQLPGSEEVFTTLNTATFADVAVVHVAKKAIAKTPLHLLFVSTGNNRISQPRCMVVAEASSQVSLVEDYVSVGSAHGGDGSGFSNAVTEIVVEANAQVEHSLIQREAMGSFHIGKTSVIQAQDSRYTNIAVQIGAALSRHNVETHHQGTQVETNLYGLALVAGTQLADTHSNIQYNHPHCQSDQLYKAIATDKGRSVFSGRVGVPKLAQQTSAAQLNRNLLLSNKARVDTKPQLEIIADDVKCSHGATVSQLEDDQVFYLQSRGIDRDSAQHLLIEAFAAEILLRLPVASLRESLTATVTQRTESAI